jgi:hypothetical protein
MSKVKGKLQVDDLFNDVILPNGEKFAFSSREKMLAFLEALEAGRGEDVELPFDQGDPS